MRRSRAASAQAAPVWLLDLLFANAPTVTWAAAGALPGGFERAEQFALMPGGGGRSFMVSLGARRGAASALTSYNGLRTGHKRVARRLIGAGLRLGLVQPLLRHRIDIGTTSELAPDQAPASLLGRHLQQVFASGPIVMAVGDGGGPYRKPVLQVFSTSGTPLGYVKVGWNDWSRTAVSREAEALRTSANRPTRVGVPELLGHSTWQGLELLITAPLPRGVRRLANGARLPVELIREISKLSAVHVGELAASPWWLGIKSRLRSGVADPEARGVIARAIERIETTHGGVVLEFATWHGDLVPWNLAQLGRRFYAWDWESSTNDAPLGFDALHYHFQVPFVARARPLAEAAALAARDARPALEMLGVAPCKHGLLAVLHILELSLRHEEARASSGDTDNRFYPSVMHLLARASGLLDPVDPDAEGRAA